MISSLHGVKVDGDSEAIIFNTDEYFLKTSSSQLIKVSQILIHDLPLIFQFNPCMSSSLRSVKL